MFSSIILMVAKKLSFYIEKINLRLEIYCYIENGELYFDIREVNELFDEEYVFNIALLSEYFQRKYRGSHRLNMFGSYCKNGNIYIKRSSLLRYFPFLINYYIKDNNKVLYKLLFFYNNLKKKRNCEIMDKCAICT